MEDWRGTEIEVGDTIVYAVKESTWVGIHEAVVTGVGEKPHPWKDGERTPYAEAEWKKSSRYGDWRKVKKVRLAEPRLITVIEKAPQAAPGSGAQ